MIEGFDSFFIFILLAMSLFALDDLFIDFVSIVFRLRPKALDLEKLIQTSEQKEKNIAIMIANWHESEVLGRMIRGNLRRIDYGNYYFFLGVYPNDYETMKVAMDLAQIHPEVKVVINKIPGPTSKGQMLNQISTSILKQEKELGFEFDLFLMHDSEDILHPHSLQLINVESRYFDFLQIPVYSFDLSLKEWIGSTYIDEFSEAHTKDLLVRDFLKAGLPSAGTGTAMNRNLFLDLLSFYNGKFLKEDTLTEDYQLGLTAHDLGYKSKFLCFFLKRKNGSKDWIATREFFPKKWSASVRQKTRWILGIIFQGGLSLEWKGAFFKRYFLWRDRRGVINLFLLSASYLTCLYFLFLEGFYFSLGYKIQTNYYLKNPFFIGLISFNFFSFIFRFLRRFWAVYQVHNLKIAFGVFPRWFLGNIINIVATYKAWREFENSKNRGLALTWQKTHHELPKDFGLDAR